MPTPYLRCGRIALAAAALLGTGGAGGTLMAHYTISGMTPFYADAGIGAPPALSDSPDDTYLRADASGPNPFRPAAFSRTFDDADPFASDLSAPLPG